MTIAQAINKALDEALNDTSVLVYGQLVKFGTAGITSGLFEKHPFRVLTFPVSEALMNSVSMGLSLAGKRPIVIHERFDFIFVGPDALINHIPIWAKKQDLPLVVLVVVGKGAGQGPQHSKNFTHWFENFEGWTVSVPDSPESAYRLMKSAIFGTKPVMYVVHREFLDSEGKVDIPKPEYIGLCGASKRHEQEFYG